MFIAALFTRYESDTEENIVQPWNKILPFLAIWRFWISNTICQGPQDRCWNFVCMLSLKCCHVNFSGGKVWKKIGYLWQNQGMIAPKSNSVDQWVSWLIYERNMHEGLLTEAWVIQKQLRHWKVLPRQEWGPQGSCPMESCLQLILYHPHPTCIYMYHMYICMCVCMHIYVYIYIYPRNSQDHVTTWGWGRAGGSYS